MAFRAGETVGPFQVVQLIGRGSFGVVLLAHNLWAAQRQIALKVVPCDHLDSEASVQAREDALAEAGLLRRLRHPHIVSCHDMGWEHERRVVWIALDYMDGGDLQAVVSSRRSAGEGPLEAHFVRRVLAAVGSALRYIHTQGVLHRDVKPSNMLLSHDVRQIKLADFGISKILEAAGSAQTVIGTPYYMAPEMVCGQPYGIATDAWALGVCLYELTALRRPFDAGNQLALARQIVDEIALALPASTASDIAQAVDGLLEKDPRRRLQLPDVLILSEAIKDLLPRECSPGSFEIVLASESPDVSLGDCEQLADASPVVPITFSPQVSPWDCRPQLDSSCMPRGSGRARSSSPPQGSRALECDVSGPSMRPGFAFGTPAYGSDKKGSATPGKEKPRGARMWFSFLRPGRSRGVSDGEATETTAISAFSYRDDCDDDSQEDTSPSTVSRAHLAVNPPTPKAADTKVAEVAKHATLKAWT